MIPTAAFCMLSRQLVWNCHLLAGYVTTGFLSPDVQKWLLSHLPLSRGKESINQKTGRTSKKKKRNTKLLNFNEYNQQDILDWCDDRRVSYEGAPLNSLPKLKSWFLYITSSND